MRLVARREKIPTSAIITTFYQLSYPDFRASHGFNCLFCQANSSRSCSAAKETWLNAMSVRNCVPLSSDTKICDSVQNDLRGIRGAEFCYAGIITDND